MVIPEKEMLSGGKMDKIQVLKPKYRTKEILKEIQECLDTSWTGMGGKY